MDKAISGNFLVGKFTNSTLQPKLNNNFKVLMPEVNLFLNSGKKIIFMFYEVAGILLLKIIGTLFYLTCSRFQELKFVKILYYFEF